ncbi:MAG: hypothetical protein IJ491_06985 [Clostridia bacterium]|nr:hypothetical protein [Clostridia bacterium]
MREITRDIVKLFEQNAIRNANNLGIRRVLVLSEENTFADNFGELEVYRTEESGYCGENLQKRKKHLDIHKAVFCSLLKLSDNLHGEELRKHLKALSSFPEGTTVVFTHSEKMQEIEKIASEQHFRTVEHFNVDRAGEATFSVITKEPEENTCFCLCVRK